ncbi:DAPG hydrolase family protein [Nannocystaceae bacterium ST9]
MTMRMITKPVSGRALGWTADELATWPYARFWNPRMAGLSSEVRHALARGPVAEPLVPGLERALVELASDSPSSFEDGFTLTQAGAMHLAIRTPMPRVSPAMIDWWFGWHGDRAERYKLWHPHAHVHAQWLVTPPAGTRGRARYLGHTSIVDEYVGSGLGRYSVRFVAPAELGLHDPRIDSGEATAICARVGLAELPIDAGWLVHHVRSTGEGSEMRSRFWIGGPWAGSRERSVVGRLVLPAARRLARASESDARALLVHCAEEMAHLASFLPELWAMCRELD